MGSWAIRLLLTLGCAVIFALHRRDKRSNPGGHSALPCGLGKDLGARLPFLGPRRHCWAQRRPSHSRGYFSSGVSIGIGSGSGNPSAPTFSSDRLASTSCLAMSHPPSNLENEPSSTDPAFWTNDVDGFELRDPPSEDRHALANSSLYLPLPSRNFRCLTSCGPIGGMPSDKNKVLSRVPLSV